ncbi:class I SAM-dependent methyltransferase [Phytoactinopolyspora alkaliphila]|uniref:Class I SAM-dependent methyltransferase n=1 Tax=Phytoactinopolyspora alkaliphila TaxID=1783498 RepID=A0A6N9YJL3_9ACTN|nr:cyclopropane-fatty-acyl-phospholipid synthase family protein [Phytoactinopolyspora alkaliphila]NED95206.1 class I SAM-dependent methyltransferase [Phytoactinopolyspora alkaliphila]
MVSGGGAAGRIAGLVERVLGKPSPLALRTWDGAQVGPEDGPVLVVNSRRALRRILWQPDELGLGRAWVAGEIDVEGDLEEALARLEDILEGLDHRPKLSASDRAEALRAAVLLGAVGPQPKPPSIEAGLAGERHSRERDRAAISHHYDVGNDFYQLVLGASMVYSCAYWTGDEHPSYTLADAQRDKNDLICRKLGLEPGMRLLDVGCGWGSLLIHAAREYGVHATGVTLSEAQAELAKRRVADAGLDHLVEVRVQDWRDVADAPFDAVASVGMAEHLGAQMWPEYVSRLYELLRPGGRLLNHQIVKGRQQSEPAAGNGRRRSFIDAYVFPDGELLPISRVISYVEGGGFEVRDVHGLREHYARTLRAWVANLVSSWDRAVSLAGEPRARVWRLYMTGSALSFDAGRIAVHQVLAVRPDEDGRSDMPMTRTV